MGCRKAEELLKAALQPPPAVLKYSGFRVLEDSRQLLHVVPFVQLDTTSEDAKLYVSALEALSRIPLHTFPFPPCAPLSPLPPSPSLLLPFPTAGVLLPNSRASNA